MNKSRVLLNLLVEGLDDLADVRTALENTFDSEIEREGSKDLRIDFPRNHSVWFRNYGPDSKSMEGSVPPSLNNTIRKKILAIAKKFGYDASALKGQ